MNSIQRGILVRREPLLDVLAQLVGERRRAAGGRAFSTTYACGLTSSSSSARPITAASRTAGCVMSADSTSIGDT